MSVVADHHATGVEAPTAKDTFDWRKPAGSVGNTRGICAHYRSLPLRPDDDPDEAHPAGALDHVYYSRQHFTAYAVLDAATGVPLTVHPRVNKGGVPWLREQGLEVACGCLIADVDNPRDTPKGPKVPWNIELYDHLYAALGAPVLAHAIWFLTRHGFRVVQPLDRWVGVDDFRPLAEGWLAALQAVAGPLFVDTQCKSWNHNYVVPRARWYEKGVRVEVDYPVDYSMAGRLSPAEVRALPGFQHVPARKTKTRTASLRPARPTAFATDLPRAWDDAAVEIGAAAAQGGFAGRRHEVFMLLAGTLAKSGVALDLVPEIVARAAEGAGFADPEHHRVSAEDTVEKLVAAGRDEVAGFRRLRALAPEFSAVVDAVAQRALDRTAVVAARPPALDPEAMGETLFGRLRYGAPGVVVVAAELGSGKSHQARRVAQDLARGVVLDRLGGRKRDRPGLHTGFSAPTHELALEHTARLRAAGTEVLRVFSPTSLRDASGGYVCVHRDAALPLQEAGVSIAREFCAGRGKPAQRCAQYDVCPAREGQDGPPKAPVVIGPYQLLTKIQGAIGTQGRLIIDEPPRPVETVVVTLQQLADAYGFGDVAFRYRATMRPLLALLHQFAETVGAPDGEGVPLATALARSAAALSEADADDAESATGLLLEDAREEGMDDEAVTAAAVLLWAKNSIEEVPGRPVDRSPPVAWSRVAAARASANLAAQLAPTLQAFRLAQDLADDPTGVLLWVASDEDGVRSLTVKRPDRLLQGALRRQGIVALLDATPGPLLEPLRTLCPSPPEVMTLAVKDRSRVDRTLVKTRGGRTSLFVDGLPDPVLIVKPLEAFARWLRGHPKGGPLRSVGVVTFLPLAIAIRGAVGGPAGRVRASVEWQERELPEDRLPTLLDAVAKALAGWEGDVLTMHYGACRGLDTFHQADVDGVATLGDPWEELSDAGRDAEVFGIDGQQLALERCVAELTQAQGRLRAPQVLRTKRALHVGRQHPMGWGWQQDEVETVEIDRFLSE